MTDDPEAPIGPPTSNTHIYTISSELSSSTSTVSSLAIIKRPQPLDSNLPLHVQLQIMNLPGTLVLNSGGQGAISPFEVLHALVHSALAPYFDAYTKGQEPQTAGRQNRFADAEAKTGIPVTKKKLAELELSLLHLQQNIEIPELFLALHPTIQRAIDEATKKNTRPTLDLIEAHLLQDSSFLNSLQSTVNAWIKSIQSITKMSRDTESGTATQEINFWLSMEMALERIEEQLRGDGVLLTLDVLKNAKRFLATVSFIADTGLKEATDRGPYSFCIAFFAHALTFICSTKI
jgi:dynein heavy chain 1